MTRIGLVAAVVAASFAAGPRASAQFTPGNIVVLRLGNGTTSLSTNTAPGTLIEINAATGAATGFSVALPTATASNAGGITFNGTTGAAPYLHRSTDGTLLTVVGYDAPVGISGVDGSLFFTHNRTIARIDSSGATITQRLTDETFSGGQARSAVSDGTRLWLGGDADASANRGLRHVSSFSATGSTRLVNADVRDMNIFNDRLFYSVPGTSGGVFVAGGSPPPTSGTTATFVSGGSNVTGFAFFDRNPVAGDPALGGLDTLYMADGANIAKVEFVGSFWSNRGFASPSQLGNLFGLTGVVNGDTVELYATDVNGNLSKLIDTSAFGDVISASNGWSSPVIAGSNFTFRGVDFAPTPVPEPGSVLAVAAAGLGLVGLVRRRRATASAGRPTP